ncbi:MAG: alpha/beta hydrolase, partial [Microcella pacifica]
SPRNWTPFVLSLENAIESQTSLADLADVTAPIDIVHGTLDPFIAPGGLKIVSQLRKVTMTRVSGMDHLIRPKLARAVERVIREHR